MKVSLDHHSSVPLHIQAEELLRSMISQPEYRNGKLLPNEVELSQQLRISRNTLRQAINRLVFEGLLIRKKGYGTHVAPMNVLSNARNWLSFSQEMKAQGITVRNFELHVSWKQASNPEVNGFFNVAPDERLLCLERLRGKPDLPFVYFISYFNPAIGMTGDEDFSAPLYDVLEQQYKVIVRTSKEAISQRIHRRETEHRGRRSRPGPQTLRVRHQRPPHRIQCRILPGRQLHLYDRVQERIIPFTTAFHPRKRLHPLTPRPRFFAAGVFYSRHGRPPRHKHDRPKSALLPQHLFVHIKKTII